jgi:carbon storage regulator
MLILSRRIGEKLMIGEDVQVIILGIRGNQVSLGIQAPANIAVHREEVFDRLKQEKLVGDKAIKNV